MKNKALEQVNSPKQDNSLIVLHFLQEYHNDFLGYGHYRCFDEAKWDRGSRNLTIIRSVMRARSHVSRHQKCILLVIHRMKYI